jgi:hypothetical protein
VIPRDGLLRVADEYRELSGHELNRNGNRHLIGNRRGQVVESASLKVDDARSDVANLEVLSDFIRHPGCDDAARIRHEFRDDQFADRRIRGK